MITLFTSYSSITTTSEPEWMREERFAYCEPCLQLPSAKKVDSFFGKMKHFFIKSY
ncbi:MAG: hypothetical protein UIC64_01390 [Agathobacter sp.]|nr:hypothetical protein [Agathobacter sp.]